MNNKQGFLRHLAETGKKQPYIDRSEELLEELYAHLSGEPLTSEAIGTFVRDRWSGYTQKFKEMYQVLSDYAVFCEASLPEFADVYREHIFDTFGGEARKAVCKFKNAIVYIPDGTEIDPFFLDGLTKEEFIEAFKSLQELMYSIYDEIERGSPFDWGWPDWKAITVDGLNHNRVMMVLEALAGSGQLNDDTLIVDKKLFSGWDICKPLTKAKMMLKGFADRGFSIEELDNKKSPVFMVSYPDTPNLVAVLCAYFKNRRSDCMQCGERCTGVGCYRYYSRKHVSNFSYRFVEDRAKQTRETLFLAIADSQPTHIRDIYCWLYDEAVMHRFVPTGCEHMGCYSYKKGNKEWLLLGSGSSYHEDEFLHSPSYSLAVKVRLSKVFKTHPEKIDELMTRFPYSFGRPWTGCYGCKLNADDCKNRVTFKKGGTDHSYCSAKHYLFFHDPDFDDVKAIYELYKLEYNIS